MLRTDVQSDYRCINIDAAETAARVLTQDLACYRSPNLGRSVVELLITIVPFALLWLMMWFALQIGYGLYLVLAVPAAGFLVRLFMIQHDCGHGAFFRHRLANDWVGRAHQRTDIDAVRFLASNPCDPSRDSGNLDRRGMGDIDTLTVGEYLSLSRWGRMQYRIYRHPLVMFGIGPAYLFFLQYRLPIGLMRAGWRPWLSTMARTSPFYCSRRSRIRIVGIVPFLLVHVPIMLIGASFGVWLFYVQHQFERTFWAHDRVWSMHEAALHGSSFYDLPIILRWFTANIGMHHVHHLCSQIPFYRLPRALRHHPDLANIGRLTLGQSLVVRASGALGRSGAPTHQFAQTANSNAAVPA